MKPKVMNRTIFVRFVGVLVITAWVASVPVDAAVGPNRVPIDDAEPTGHEGSDARLAGRNPSCVASASTVTTLTRGVITENTARCLGATCWAPTNLTPPGTTGYQLWEIVCIGTACDQMRAYTSVKLLAGGTVNGISAWARAESWCGPFLRSSSEVTWPGRNAVDLLGQDKYPPDSKYCVFKFRHVLDGLGNYKAEAECS